MASMSRWPLSAKKNIPKLREVLHSCMPLSKPMQHEVAAGNKDTNARVFIGHRQHVNLAYVSCLPIDAYGSRADASSSLSPGRKATGKRVCFMYAGL